jgi:hypothetical protein
MGCCDNIPLVLYWTGKMGGAYVGFNGWEESGKRDETEKRKVRLADRGGRFRHPG